MGVRGRGWIAWLLIGSAWAGATDLAAQEPDSIPGVTLGLLYETTYLPPLAIQPFTGRLGGETTAPRVEAIVARDLRYSDRFEVMDSLPAGLIPDEVDYQLWDQLGAVWLVSGRLEGAGEGFVLMLELHDVVFQEVKKRARFPVPNPDAEGFRMAVHLASDAIVQWVFSEPGIAATRIAFSRRDDEGNSDLFLIDSDGENLRRITRNQSISVSPAWSPDGSQVVYSTWVDGAFRLYALDPTTGRQAALPIDQDGDHQTPEFSPQGDEIAFSVVGGGRAGLYTYDIARECCVQYVSGGDWIDLNPTYGPDGREIAFMSSRLGDNHPQVFTMPSSGGEADLVSPYTFGPNAGYYTSPDWSPTGRYVAFHGRVTRRGFFQILVAEIDAGRRRLRQLTWEGENEDPTWAPDGRHLAFVGRRKWGTGLMIVDSATGNTRMLLRGVDVRVPAWSPTLEGTVRGPMDGGDR
jgi:TolB protein